MIKYGPAGEACPIYRGHAGECRREWQTHKVIFASTTLNHGYRFAMAGIACGSQQTANCVCSLAAAARIKAVAYDCGCNWRWRKFRSLDHRHHGAHSPASQWRKKYLAPGYRAIAWWTEHQDSSGDWCSWQSSTLDSDRGNVAGIDNCQWGFNYPSVRNAIARPFLWRGGQGWKRKKWRFAKNKGGFVACVHQPNRSG